MLNAIPFLGWFLAAFFNISISVPFWFVWTHCGIGEKYFYWLPSVYQSIPFWNCVGLFTVVAILRAALTPKLAEINQSNKST